MTPQFRNLIFEGGGIKGIAYIGALEILSQRGHLKHLSRVGGSSAGAINALILALGYSIREQQHILESTNFRDFMDRKEGTGNPCKQTSQRSSRCSLVTFGCL